MTAAAPTPEPLTLDDPAYFTRLAQAESSHWWSLGLWKLASHWLNLALRGRSHLSALDIGCGAGGTLQRLTLRPEIDSVIGLDPSPSALALTRSPARTVLQANATALPFPDSSFDLVTCLDVWQHLPPGGDLLCALEIHRILRPHGLLLLRANGRGLRPPHSGPAPYTLSHLCRLLQSSGFTLRRASYANCLPSIAQELLGPLRRSSSPRSSHPSGAGLRLHHPPPPLARLMTTISTVEALLAGRLGIPLPIGHTTIALAEKKVSGTVFKKGVRNRFQACPGARQAPLECGDSSPHSPPARPDQPNRPDPSNVWPGQSESSSVPRNRAGSKMAPAAPTMRRPTIQRPD